MRFQLNIDSTHHKLYQEPQNGLWQSKPLVQEELLPPDMNNFFVWSVNGLLQKYGMSVNMIKKKTPYVE